MSYVVEREVIVKRVLKVTESSFDAIALDLFRFQYAYNPVYRQFVDALHLNPSQIEECDQIPFLPIETFKHRRVQTGFWEPEATFLSSGTTQSERSRHLVRDMTFYHQHARVSFDRVLPSWRERVVLALLPNYLEAGQSSLVSMVRAFMETTAHPLNDFFLHDFEALRARIDQLIASELPFILFGVSYALLDFAQKHAGTLGDQGVIVETGGMKGRAREMLKEELYEILYQQLHPASILTEYGMTELMSQAYSSNGHSLQPAETMRVLIKEINDPTAFSPEGSSGVIHIIDLANVDSCAFIATQDLGIAYPNGTFRILGRLDQSDLRGCQLLYLQ